MTRDLNNIIQQEAELLFEKVMAYREHLHMYPELSFQEHQTMEFVSKTLHEIGIHHESGIGGTGVVALISPNNQATSSPCIGLRADLDALPIKEENEVTYRSKHEGVMHACGHDVHTAILLGVAEILQKHNSLLKQPVKLIFQPGEEKNPGGASILIRAGVLENPVVERMYGLHVYPEFQAGHVGFKPGLYMASCDEIHLTIIGKGGHGAMPENCIDPIAIGSSLITQLQQVVSRRANPTTPSVLSFGHFEALGSTNIIPERAHIKGTFRTHNEQWRNEALHLIETQTNAIISSFGAQYELNISRGYPCLINDESTTENLKSKAIKVLGQAHVHDLTLRMTSEDFAFYSQEIPVCFFRLGVSGNHEQFGVHHPKFNIDSKALITGMQILSAACFDI